MTIEEATDAEIFLVYLEEVLCPALKAGDVVVMDNLGSHKVMWRLKRLFRFRAAREAGVCSLRLAWGRWKL
jgi:hypothetical protein